MKQQLLLTSAAKCLSLLVNAPPAGDWLPLVLQASLHATDAVIAGAVVAWLCLEVQMTIHAADADADGVIAGAALTQKTRHEGLDAGSLSVSALQQGRTCCYRHHQSQ